ncbi:MAG TPA: hypothetical protein VHA74_02985 [Candidatus Dojkabacteria bacterium]|nr:hypothetical protein [Candidatus Dojkabacteria bacterium]
MLQSISTAQTTPEFISLPKEYYPAINDKKDPRISALIYSFGLKVEATVLSGLEYISTDDPRYLCFIRIISLQEPEVLGSFAIENNEGNYVLSNTPLNISGDYHDGVSCRAKMSSNRQVEGLYVGAIKDNNLV